MMHTFESAFSIENITFNSGVYTITSKSGHKLRGYIQIGNDRDLYRDLTDDKNLLTPDIKEAFWLNSDEYCVVITRLFECLPDDEILPLGTIRHYVTNHMDEEQLINFVISEKETTTEKELDSRDIQHAIFSYLGWDF